MKRIHILLMALVALSIQGCQDDFNVPSEQASRSYEAGRRGTEQIRRHKQDDA